MIEKAFLFAKAIIEYKKTRGLQNKLRIALQMPNGKFLKWIDESEFLQKYDELLKDPMISALHMTKLENQLVMELDIEDEEKRKEAYSKLFEYLKLKRWKYFAIWSGNKSVHIHVLFKPDKPENLRKLKEFVSNSLAKVLDGFDLHIAKDTTLYRLPGSFHHKSGNYAQFIAINDYSLQLNKALSEQNVKQIVEILKDLENDFVIKETENKKLIQITYVEKRIRKKQKKKGKLFNLYQELLNTKVEDGRDRVLMILVTIAKFLNVNPKQFAQDLEQWAKLNEWKEYRWRNWVKYYEENRYSWMSNWRWAIKEFLTAKDIEEKSYQKVREIIGKYLPWALEKWKR